MAVKDADELVAFRNVKHIGSTAQAVFCQIGKRRVWLPRRHTSGELYGAGDFGQPLIQSWVACDRHLLDRLDGGTVPRIAPSIPASSLRRGRGAHDAS